jgi:hypothetical protein
MDKYDEERGADKNDQEGRHGRVGTEVTDRYANTLESELRKLRNLQLVVLVFDALSRPSWHVESPCFDG